MHIIHGSVSFPHRPMFRSYKPLDKDLQQSTLPDAKPEKIEQQLTGELDKANEATVLEEIVIPLLGCRGQS